MVDACYAVNIEEELCRRRNKVVSFMDKKGVSCNVFSFLAFYLPFLLPLRFVYTGPQVRRAEQDAGSAYLHHLFPYASD